jgi:ketosteroid isomerase-like protein
VRRRRDTEVGDVAHGLEGGVSVQAATLDVLAEFRERFECYNRHDFDAMEAMYRPDAVFDPSRVFPGERPRSGYGEMREYWKEIWEIWDGVRMDPVEVLDVGGDRYVVVVELGARGRRSGANVARPMAFLYALREGLIARADVFPDREAALAAAAEDDG